MTWYNRAMDSGDQPFVVNRGHRWPMPEEILYEFDLVSGQQISDELVQEIIMGRLTRLLAEKAIKKAMKNQQGENDAI